MSNDIEITISGVDKSKSAFAGAKKSADDFADHVRKTGSKLGDGLGDDFKRGSDRGFKGIAASVGGAARDIGGNLAAGLGDVMGKDPKIAAGIAAGIVTGAPFIGAALSGAVTGAAGIGAVAAGFALIKDDPRIKAAGDGLKENLLGSLRDSASVMTDPVLVAIERVGVRAAGLGDEFDRIFGRAATFVEPLTSGLLDAAEAVTGGLADALDGALPVIEAVSDGMSDLGDAVGDTLSGMADNGAANAEALTIVLKALEGGIRAVGGVTNFLADQYRNLSYGAHVLVGDQEGANALFEESAPLIDKVGDSYQVSAEKAQEMADAVNAVVDAARAETDANLSAAEANLRYAEELDKVKEAIDGKNTVSREETAALQDLARISNRQITAMEEAGAATEEVAAKSAEAERAFRQQAAAAGYNTAEIDKMVAEWMTVPKEVITNMQVNGVQDSINEAARLKNYLRNIPDEVVNVVTNLTGATGSRARAEYAKQYAHGGIIGAAATGGNRGGMTWVGEQGPELVKLPFGSTVYPAGQSQAMAAQGTGGGPVRLVFDFRNAGDALGAAMIAFIQDSVRVEGGGDVNYLAGGVGY